MNSFGVLLVLCALVGYAVCQMAALEAQVGSTVTLECPSNDDNHRFQFWQLLGDKVIGPGNPIDREKYKYEVLTGTLYIKGVSTAETGFYKCVSREVNGQGLHILAVELVVRKDWEGEWETDHDTNVFRGVVAIGVLLGLIAIGLLLFVFYRRQRIVSRIRDMSADEESPDEVPIRGTYNSTTIPSTSHGIDNPVLDTEFPPVFKTLQSSN